MSILDSFRLDGRTALITGAGRGLGAAMARALAEAGAAVAVADMMPERAEKTSQGINDSGGRSIALTVDVTDEGQVQKMVAETEKRLGPLSIAINNAGIGRLALATEMSVEVWREVMDVNLKAVFMCVKAEALRMKANGGGSIINTASITGSKINGALRGLSAYAASKAGVKMLSKAQALDLAQFNIRVNCISPGVMETEIHGGDLQKPEVYQTVLAGQLIKRLGQPVDVAGAAVFLASDASSFVTGHDLFVDGGQMVL